VLECIDKTMTVGKGFVDLPLVDTRVVDMSLCCNGICQSLLQQVLAIERPEFESQKQSSSKDVIRLRHELTCEQVHCSILNSR